MVSIKICGVRETATCDLLLKLRVNWVGLVFYPASPRFLSVTQARQLPDYGKEGLLRVGLFVRPKLDDIRRILDKVRLDILQLYCSDKQAAIIREEIGLPVWLAKGVKTRDDLLEPCQVDGMVIEAPFYESDTRPGGNGRKFDWSLTKNWNPAKPWLLAGGLTPDNVQEAIQQSGTEAIDVSSGVESEPGKKDPILIQHFVKNARQEYNCE
ncbi:phosphoribosylanthranilate isomerase [Commensalibacter sp. M0134]|uniref:phosphoribosylanthranilate isomerase n=1 Tax=Commensalibacter TaxID=1079922 RepID=UPI0012D9BC8C|nr:MULTISPECIES: phosphoribosylanthranilate isomerase [Commensalibacter]MBI0066168.1 phosphoribosylanthranilate isomerase [Commensalibacter sp. M0134]MBI0070051.1 phosphoribosylanthranilate isomerase [Commensalibacter sp. M0133]MBI0081483.1 phosphoribosylanthranilate isomerase [Commensalibacter melissae]MUG81886.1 N-(5'-phosphoribosyl)anthranilate isomerase [Commensalibacter melissae]